MESGKDEIAKKSAKGKEIKKIFRGFPKMTNTNV